MAPVISITMPVPAAAATGAAAPPAAYLVEPLATRSAAMGRPFGAVDDSLTDAHKTSLDAPTALRLQAGARDGKRGAPNRRHHHRLGGGNG